MPHSVLQDDFFQHMRAAGYTDVERGERDSTEEHLTVTQFKVAKEKQRLEAVTAELNQKEAQLDDTTQAAEKKKQELKSLQAQTKAATGIAVTVQELESMGKKSFTGNIVLTPDECRTLKNYAVSSFAEKAEKLKYQQKYETAKKDAGVWKKRYEKLLEQAQPYLDAVKLAPERVRAFLNAVLTRGKEKQDIPQERGRKKRRALLTDKWNGFADLLANLIEKYAAVLDIDNLPEPPSCLEEENTSEEPSDTIELMEKQ